ncbi:MAG: hypothetical protein KGJ01_03690, partial [Patescibacteria group bacterium]|nr:hypothetical protein [Patescibacteria group bacterium]
AEGNENPALYKKEVELVDMNFLNGAVTGEVFARVRYRQPLAKAMLMRKEKNTAKKVPSSKLQAPRFKLVFDKPQKFIAEGQSAVFYDKKGVMLGGGIII